MGWRLAVLPAVVVLAGCGGGRQEMTVYLEQRLGPEGPPGQIAPVLMPVERERREGLSPLRQAVLDLRVGPAPAERVRGFQKTLEPTTRLSSVRVIEETAIVDLSGREPDVYGDAAIVYSLTEVAGIARVSLLLDGEPCCAYDHAGTVIPVLTRATYSFWQGEPCGLRTRQDSVRCRNP